jgi:protein-tyrosine phosphatase
VVIDLHSHVLPGIDDGPADLDGAVALARAAVQAGTEVMAATPHIGHRFGVVPEQMPGLVAALQTTLDAEGVPLHVVTGGELAPTLAADLSMFELEAIALGGRSCVLLECPFTASGALMPSLVAHLHERDFRVLLAHPERSPGFLREPALLVKLTDAGAHTQITAGSLVGEFGRTIQRYSFALLAEDLVHVVASDAHDAEHRGPALAGIVADAVRHAGLPATTAAYLTVEAPRALLDDEPVPLSPSRTRPRRRGWPRRG